MSVFRALAVWLLIICQLMVYFVVGLSPAVSTAVKNLSRFNDKQDIPWGYARECFKYYA